MRCCCVFMRHGLVQRLIHMQCVNQERARGPPPWSSITLSAGPLQQEMSLATFRAQQGLCSQVIARKGLPAGKVTCLSRVRRAMRAPTRTLAGGICPTWHALVCARLALPHRGGLGSFDYPCVFSVWLACLCPWPCTQEKRCIGYVPAFAPDEQVRSAMKGDKAGNFKNALLVADRGTSVVALTVRNRRPTDQDVSEVDC